MLEKLQKNEINQRLIKKNQIRMDLNFDQEGLRTIKFTKKL